MSTIRALVVLAAVCGFVAGSAVESWAGPGPGSGGGAAQTVKVEGVISAVNLATGQVAITTRTGATASPYSLGLGSSLRPPGDAAQPSTSTTARNVVARIGFSLVWAGRYFPARPASRFSTSAAIPAASSSGWPAFPSTVNFATSLSPSYRRGAATAAAWSAAAGRESRGCGI